MEIKEPQGSFSFGGDITELKEGLGLSPVTVLVTVKGLDGKVRRQTEYHNMIMDRAKQAIAAWLTGRNNTGYNPLPPPSAIALGTGTGTITKNDAALFTETPGTRKTLSYSQVVQGTYAEWVAEYLTTDPAGTYTEIGLFAGTDLWAHVSISESKSASETLTVQWKWGVEEVIP